MSATRLVGLVSRCWCLSYAAALVMIIIVSTFREVKDDVFGMHRAECIHELEAKISNVRKMVFHSTSAALKLNFESPKHALIEANK